MRTLTYDTTRILTYYEVELRISYSRTAKEMDELREVTGLAGVRQELSRLVREQQGSATRRWWRICWSWRGTAPPRSTATTTCGRPPYPFTLRRASGGSSR